MCNSDWSYDSSMRLFCVCKTEFWKHRSRVTSEQSSVSDSLRCEADLSDSSIPWAPELSWTWWRSTRLLTELHSLPARCFKTWQNPEESSTNRGSSARDWFCFFHKFTRKRFLFLTMQQKCGIELSSPKIEYPAMTHLCRKAGKEFLQVNHQNYWRQSRYSSEFKAAHLKSDKKCLLCIVKNFMNCSSFILWRQVRTKTKYIYLSKMVLLFSKGFCYFQIIG